MGLLTTVLLCATVAVIGGGLAGLGMAYVIMRIFRRAF